MTTDPNDQMPSTADATLETDDLLELIIALCGAWSRADAFVLQNIDILGDRMDQYPIFQGTANQVTALRLGALPYDAQRAAKTLLSLDPSRKMPTVAGGLEVADPKPANLSAKEALALDPRRASSPEDRVMARARLLPSGEGPHLVDSLFDLIERQSKDLESIQTRGAKKTATEEDLLSACMAFVRAGKNGADLQMAIRAALEACALDQP